MTAATEHEQAQAGRQGSVFTYAVTEAVKVAVKEKLPLTPKDIQEFANEFIAAVLKERPALIHHPTVYGDAALLGKNLLETSGGAAAVAAPAPPPAPAPVATPAPPAAAPTVVAAPAVAVPPSTQAAGPAAGPPPAATPAAAPPARPQAAPVTQAPAPAPRTQTPPAAAAPAPAPAVTAAATSAAPGAVWSQLQNVAKKAAYTVRFSASKAAYQVGEQLVLDVDVNADGYLNVLNVGAGDSAAVVLYPNKYHPDNAVKADRRSASRARVRPTASPRSCLPARASSSSSSSWSTPRRSSARTRRAPVTGS